MNSLTIKLKTEHQELYKKLEVFLQELTQMKNQRNDQRLLRTCKELLEYIKQLLDGHFEEEESILFPQIKQPDLIARLLDDHRDIHGKYDKVREAYENFDKNKDYKQELLFPAYNLIATINHHAAREDKELFNQNGQE